MRTHAFAVVPEPMNGSYTISPSLVQDNMWSIASCSGKIAGCPVLSFSHDVVYFQILLRSEYSGTGFIFLPVEYLPSFVYPVQTPHEENPAYLLGLSHNNLMSCLILFLVYTKTFSLYR